jgi:tetratricopeptide (TPR) repeat protein
MSAKQYAVALAKYEKALSVWGSKPADQAMIFAMGACAYRVNDMKKSLKYFDMSIASGYNPDMSYQYRALIMKAQNNNEEYLKTLKEGLAKVPASKVLKEMLAKYYFTEGDKHYHTGKEILKNAADQVNAGKYSVSDPAFMEQNNKAKAEFNDALKWLNMSLELNPADKNAEIVKKNTINQMNVLL